jgi:hypothetical protein
MSAPADGDRPLGDRPAPPLPEMRPLVVDGCLTRLCFDAVAGSPMCAGKRVGWKVEANERTPPAFALCAPAA